MNDKATFQCEYLAFSSNYEDRLLTKRKINDLADFVSEKQVIPLFVLDPSDGV